MNMNTNTFIQEKQKELSNFFNELQKKQNNQPEEEQEPMQQPENVKGLSVQARKEAKARANTLKVRGNQSKASNPYELPEHLRLEEVLEAHKVNKWEFIKRVNDRLLLWVNKSNGCKSCFEDNINPNSIKGIKPPKSNLSGYYFINAVGDQKPVEYVNNIFDDE